MSYDVYVWDYESRPIDSVDAALSWYRAALDRPGASEVSISAIADFLYNVRQLLPIGLEIFEGSDWAVVHLPHHDDVAQSVVEQLASLAGLHLLDPQTRSVYPP